VCSRKFPGDVTVFPEIDGSEVEASFGAGVLSTSLLVSSRNIPTYLLKIGKKGAKAPIKSFDKQMAKEKAATATAAATASGMLHAAPTNALP
jgi:hypothetical protein